MPDIFLSYSSQDRDVAERVQQALSDDGYDVFWDQSTPPGQDWDTWIRDQLRGSACVLVLWSKASVISPNVRHEAIIAREKGKLLPVMIDALEPTDFPMGLFLMQALIIGRSRRSLEKAWPKLVEEVEAKLKANSAPADPAEPPAPPRRKKPRKRHFALIGAGIFAGLLALAAILHFSDLTIFLDPDAPPVPAERVAAAVNSEQLARQRVVRSADEALGSGRNAVGTSWVWLAGQLISAAPQESRGIAPAFFRYLGSGLRADCGCFYTEEVPHAVGNAWVIIALSDYRQPLPERMIPTILASQSPEGWWPMSFTATRDSSNAATHATAFMTIALSRLRDAGALPPDQRPAVDAAIARAVTWLNRGPELGSQWTDYPTNERRIENLVFAAMATVATRVAGQGAGRAEAAFVRSAEELPGSIDSFPSNAYVELSDGNRFVDQYRHPVSPWIGAAATMAYRDAGIWERRRLRRIVRDWVALDIGDERLLRQDWLTGETLFLRGLAFPRLTETQ